MSVTFNWYRKSFRNKLVTAVLGVFIGVYFLTLQWAYATMSSDLLSAAKKESISTSAILVMALYRSFDLETDKREILSFLHGSQKYRENLTLIRVFNRQQEVVSSTLIDEIGSRPSHSAHQKALANVTVNEMLVNDSTAVLKVFYPISAGSGSNNKASGFIETHYDISAVSQTLAALRLYFIVGGLLMALIIAVVLIRIASSITQPMRTLYIAMKQVENDRLDIQVPVTSKDEVGFLSGSFNRMITAINLSRVRLNQLVAASIQFVPNEFLQILGIEEITQVKMGDAKQQALTVLFLDIRDFTRLSSHLTAPQVLAFLNELNRYLIPRIEANNGFVDKFIGDAIMAIFPGSPDDAVCASNELFEALDAFNQAKPFEHIPLIDIGIGINHGNTIIGTVGSENRMDTTVIGDTVNIASRMESLTKTLNAKILMPERVFSQLKPETTDKYFIKSLGQHSVKGLATPVDIYGVVD